MPTGHRATHCLVQLPWGRRMLTEKQASPTVYPKINVPLFLTGGELDSTRGRDAATVGTKGRQTDRQTARTAQTPPVPARPSLPSFPGTQSSRGTAGQILRSLEDNNQDRPPQEQFAAPGSSKPPSHGCSRLGLPEEPSRCRPGRACPGTTIACRSLSTTWEAAGGDPAGKGSNCRHCLGLAEHQSHPNPQPGIPNLPRPCCCELPVLREFFSKLGRKSLRDRNNQKAAGSGSEAPPGGIAWDGDAGRETGTPQGDQGCQKPSSRAMSRAGAAVPWAGGVKRVMRTQHCKNQLHWTLGTAPQRAWSQPSPCSGTHIYPILRALRVTLKESLKES